MVFQKSFKTPNLWWQHHGQGNSICCALMVIWDSSLRMSGLYRKNRVLLANSTSSGSDWTTAGGGFSALFRSACARDNSFFNVAISLSKMDLAGKLSRMSSVCSNPSPKIPKKCNKSRFGSPSQTNMVENCGK